MRKILYISGTRADYGLMRQALFCIKRHPGLELEIAVTGMHLMPAFGKTIEEIRKDDFKIHEIKAIYKNDTRESMSNFVGKCILLLTEKIKRIKPDIILLLGDRGEMLAAAIVGVYLSIPVVHIHGGDVTSTVDEIIRHTITKLSHLHLAATHKSAQRIIKMGEDRWRVHMVGAPGLDSILNEELLSKNQIAKKYKMDLSSPILLVIQHPVTAQVKKAELQMIETMEAIREVNFQSIVIYPNADAGGRKIIKVIKRYSKFSYIQTHKNILRRDFLSLMKIASAIVGNSSSAIIEAPLFHLPIVNIGERQEGREKVENIIEVDYKREQIKKAIKKAIYDKRFKKTLRNCKNPYGDGKAGERIAKILGNIRINKELLQKKITY